MHYFNQRVCKWPFYCRSANYDKTTIFREFPLEMFLTPFLNVTFIYRVFSQRSTHLWNLMERRTSRWHTWTPWISSPGRTQSYWIAMWIIAIRTTLTHFFIQEWEDSGGCSERILFREWWRRQPGAQGLHLHWPVGDSLPLPDLCLCLLDHGDG